VNNNEGWFDLQLTPTFCSLSFDPDSQSRSHNQMTTLNVKGTRGIIKMSSITLDCGKTGSRTISFPPGKELDEILYF